MIEKIKSALIVFLFALIICSFDVSSLFRKNNDSRMIVDHGSCAIYWATFSNDNIYYAVNNKGEITAISVVK